MKPTMLSNHPRFVVLLTLTIIFVFIFYANDGVSHSREIISHVKSAAKSGSFNSLFHEVPEVDDLEFDNTYGYNGLTQLCDETEWTDGLWLHCHSRCGENQTSVCGGLNNARNRIQTCLRLAIDGGMGLIIPSATLRDEGNLVNTGKTTVCADTFWDIDNLQASMATRCRQFKIRRCDDRSGINTVIDTPARMYLDGSYTNGTFGKFIQTALATENLTRYDITPEAPVAINFADSYIGWNYRYSFELSTIRKALFKVLKFNHNLLDISSEVLASPQLQEGAFIGVHLRGEDDWPAGFGGVQDQMRLYAEAIQKIRDNSSMPINTVYVSCGSAAAISNFRDLLTPQGFVVHDKWTILASQPSVLAEVQALAFDQKAIVEYHTLVQANYWMGIITSSMSSLIAYAREVGEEEDFFEKWVFPGSSKAGFDRGYADAPKMMGNQRTQLMVLSGPDIMESFP